MKKKSNKKMIIYQVLPRLFGNNHIYSFTNGTLAQNGCGKMNDFTPEAFDEIKRLGATHIWYTGLLEHATQTDYSIYGIAKDHPSIVKGKAGSPYAIKDYYDIDPDLAVNVRNRMGEFENLVARTHEAGLKMIIDFVPNHVSRQYHSDAAPQGVEDFGAHDNKEKAFSEENNFYYIPGQALRAQFDLKAGAEVPYVENPARATANDRFDAYPNDSDWYEAVKLNYGVDYQGGGSYNFYPFPDTWKKMFHILNFWASKGVDGFRCDMVEMVPVAFWAWVIPQIKQKYNVDFIGEVYNPNEYHNFIEIGRFDYLYDKVGLYDTLRNITCGYASANDITKCWQSTNDIQEKMLHFMENHDEQRIASTMFLGSGRQGKAAMIISAAMLDAPVMWYMGQDIGERGMNAEGFSGIDGRTTIFDYWSLESIYRWRNENKFDQALLTQGQKDLQSFYCRLFMLCQSEKAIREGEFFGLQYANLKGWRYNENKQYSFVRYSEGELIIGIVNFDEYEANVGVLLPKHLFEYFNLPALEEVEVVELFSEKTERITFLPNHTVDTTVGSFTGKLLKMKIEK